MTNAFIDEYIWEIHNWPKYGPNLEYHFINDIYYYNSLTCDYEDKKQSTCIQIPEQFISKLEHKQTIIDNMDFIKQKQIPVITKISDDEWFIDLQFLRHELGKIQN
jgi:hypothetical protein